MNTTQEVIRCSGWYLGRDGHSHRCNNKATYRTFDSGKGWCGRHRRAYDVRIDPSGKR
jgi:hypothetical protein